MRALTLFSLILAPGVAAVAHAQQAPAAGATANAIGVAFDSIRMRPLVGARVRVDTSELIGTTDANGRFHIEGIPAGAHVLRVQHPLVDTLGVVLRSDQEMFAAGQTKALELATPSPETLVQILCSAAWRNRGPTALMGRVYEADSGKPAVGAKVSFVWYELDVTNQIRRVPRVREAVVGADGAYRICGLPAEVEGRAQVIKGGLTSGDIPLNFGENVLTLRSMSIALPGAGVVAAAPGTGSDSAAPTAAPLGSARLSGRVVTKAGQPLAGARVQLDGTTRVATTRPTGEFTLDSLPSGTQTVSARLLGYAPVEAAVDLSSREARNVTLSMDVFVPVLETVRVSAQRERALDDVGFSRRKRQGMGWYMESDAIKARNSQFFSDLLRGAPGIRISSAGGNRQYIEDSRNPTGGCVNIWVDGSQWQQLEPGDVDDFVKPWELAALEVYSATNTPAEYAPAGRSSCATIVGWTDRRLDRKRK